MIACKNRNQVERGFGRRKQWRGMATRFDKLGDSYRATLDLAETLDWLRYVPGRGRPAARGRAPRPQ